MTRLNKAQIRGLENARKHLEVGNYHGFNAIVRSLIASALRPNQIPVIKKEAYAMLEEVQS